MSYNLSDNVNEDFVFTIEDKAKKVHTFVMRYPLVEELEKMQEIIAKQDSSKETSQTEANKEVQEYIYGFITPTGDQKDSISDVLKKSNIKLLARFNTMIQKEFGIS